MLLLDSASCFCAVFWLPAFAKLFASDCVVALVVLCGCVGWLVGEVLPTCSVVCLCRCVRVMLLLCHLAVASSFCTSIVCVWTSDKYLSIAFLLANTSQGCRRSCGRRPPRQRRAAAPWMAQKEGRLASAPSSSRAAAQAAGVQSHPEPTQVSQPLLRLRKGRT